MIYEAPEIINRIAAGDDCFIPWALSDGRLRLVPSPDSVTAVGTEIDKALMQPLVDAVAWNNKRINEWDSRELQKLLCYWWRRKSYAAQWVETQADAWDDSDGSYYYHSSSANGVFKNINLCRYYNDVDTNGTIAYSNSIAINQSSGAVSLSNPTTVTATSDNYRDVGALIAGKYCTGLMPSPSRIRYVNSSASVTSHGWRNSDGSESITEYGYDWSERTSYNPRLYDIGSRYNETIGQWEAVFNESSDAHPHSGTVDGYTWEYMGRAWEILVKLITGTQF